MAFPCHGGEHKDKDATGWIAIRSAQGAADAVQTGQTARTFCKIASPANASLSTAEAAAHAVARMTTPAHRTLMPKFRNIADRFFFDGSVIGQRRGRAAAGLRKRAAAYGAHRVFLAFLFLQRWARVWPWSRRAWPGGITPARETRQPKRAGSTRSQSRRRVRSVRGCGVTLCLRRVGVVPRTVAASRNDKPGRSRVGQQSKAVIRPACDGVQLPDQPNPSRTGQGKQVREPPTDSGSGRIQSASDQ